MVGARWSFTPVERIALYELSRASESVIEVLDEDEFVVYDYLIHLGPYHAISESLPGQADPHDVPLAVWVIEAAELDDSKAFRGDWRRLTACKECRRLLRRGERLLSILSQVSGLPKQVIRDRVEDNYLEALMLLFAVEPRGDGWAGA